jgi:hypothetical protein
MDPRPDISRGCRSGVGRQGSHLGSHPSPKESKWFSLFPGDRLVPGDSDPADQEIGMHCLEYIGVPNQTNVEA